MSNSQHLQIKIFIATFKAYERVTFSYKHSLYKICNMGYMEYFHPIIWYKVQLYRFKKLNKKR